MSESCASRSTILPLPSSPHCAPTMTVAGTSWSLPELDGKHAERRSVRALDADLVAPHARDGGVLAVELEPPLHLCTEVAVLGGALLADDGVRRCPWREP